MIIEAWKNLDRGGVLKLIVDREPKPLHFLLRTKYRGRFEWQYLREGPPDWSVAIKKL